MISLPYINKILITPYTHLCLNLSTDATQDVKTKTIVLQVPRNTYLDITHQSVGFIKKTFEMR